MSRMRRSPRGATLAVTLWAMVAVTAVVLVLANASRVETVAVGNRLSRIQADAAERGAEQWMISVVEQEVAQPGSTASIQMCQRIIGACAVWVISPDPDNPGSLKYGLTDEGGKIDLNTATEEMLVKLPGMTYEAADAIIDWRDPDSNETGQGAEDSFYLSPDNHPDFPEAYKAKNADFESVDELRLVRGINDAVLYGADRNRNGLADEIDSGGSGLSFGGFDTSGSAPNGIYPYVTAWGVRATAASANSTTNTGGITAVADVNSFSTTRLRTVLTNTVPNKVESILDNTRQLRPFANVFDWYFKVGLSQDEFSQIFTQITANPPAGGGGGEVVVLRRTAKVNVYAAPREVLMCLPGLEEKDAEDIIGGRSGMQTGTPADLSWLVGVLPQEKLVPIGGLITGASKVFSADIVAVSEDGRAFKRVRIVVDGSVTPAKIIYRRDMTAAGWPLPEDVRSQLRQGGGLDNVSASPRQVISKRGSAPL